MEERRNGNKLKRFLYFLPGFGHRASSKVPSDTVFHPGIFGSFWNILYMVSLHRYSTAGHHRDAVLLLLCVYGSASFMCRSSASSNCAANALPRTLAERYFTKLRKCKQQREQKKFSFLLCEANRYMPIFCF